MSKPISWFLRRANINPAGIATGGGETGFFPQPQESLFTVVLFGGTSQFKDVLLPKGAIITNYVVFPFNSGDSGGGGFDGVAATAGAVTIDTWDIVNNVSLSSLLGATSGTAYSKTAVGTPAALAADTRVRFRVSTAITPFTSGAQGNGAVMVGFTAIMPRIRK